MIRNMGFKTEFTIETEIGDLTEILHDLGYDKTEEFEPKSFKFTVPKDLRKYVDETVNVYFFDIKVKKEDNFITVSYPMNYSKEDGDVAPIIKSLNLKTSLKYKGSQKDYVILTKKLGL